MNRRMFLGNLILITILLLQGCSSSTSKTAEPIVAKEEIQLAQKPPMGWNSYNCFGGNVTEAEVKDNADYMAKKLTR